MTTKPPSAVYPAPTDSLERIAYAATAGIPTAEPHDLDRLGYSIWLWLTQRRDPLPVAIKAAGCRFLIPEQEAVDRVSQNLIAAGIHI